MGFFSGIGSVFGGIGSALGGVVDGLLGSDSDKKNQQAAQAHADAQRAEDIALQREFAQNSIQWRVEDAKKAGLHPLAALGVSGYQYTPVGGTTFSRNTRDLGIGNALSSMGQSIDRAREAGMTRAQREKAEAFSDEYNVLQLRHAELQNTALELEIASREARLRQSNQEARPLPLSTGPDGTILMTGQADSYQPGIAAQAPAVVAASPLVSHEPSQIVANELGHPAQQAGSDVDYSFDRIQWRNGLVGYAPSRMRGAQKQDKHEEDWLGGISWNLRHRLNPMLGIKRTAPPLSWLPKGYSYWSWNIPNMAWVPARSRKFGHLWSNTWGF